MTKQIMLSVQIPFEGFFCSAYSEEIDHQESHWFENVCNESDYDTNEPRYPEPLRIDEREMLDLLIDASDYSQAYLSIAHAYVDAFSYHAGEIMGFTESKSGKRSHWTKGAGWVENFERWTQPGLSLQFETMTSPREYNFQTDRLFALIPLKIMREIFKRSNAEDHETLARVIDDRHSSRSGFISFYSNDLSDWVAKPLRDWDYIELGTLLLTGLKMAGADLDGSTYDSSTFYGEIFETVMGGEGAYDFWQDCVDWENFDLARDELRAEKLEEWRESDPDAAELYEPSEGGDSALAAVRCPLTIDLFAQGEGAAS
jgi:hypothetical protein